MKAEEPDEIIGEIDLILSQPPPTTNIHILQYPLRDPAIPPGTEREIISASQRPRAGRLQLKLAVHPTAQPVNPDTASFDDAQEDAVMKNIGDTQTLRSRPHRSSPDANYTIGKYDASRSAFVVVPVDSVTQLRPAFDYLDAHDMKILQARLAEKRTDSKSEGEGVSAVQMSFRRRETERAAERRKNSHATLRMLEEGEPWQMLKYHPKEENMHRIENLFNRGVNIVKAEDSKAFVDCTDYEAMFRVHTRHVAMGHVAKGALDVDRFSIQALRSLPVNSAITQMFAFARILRIRDVCTVLPNSDVTEVLNCARVVAVCLRGCWVMKKGTKDAGRARSGVDRYDAGRFLILDLFRRTRIVRTVDACNVLGQPMLLSRHSVETILKEVSDHESGKGWVFRLEDDEEFQNEHRDLVTMQEEDWKKRVASAREKLTATQRGKRK